MLPRTSCVEIGANVRSSPQAEPEGHSKNLAAAAKQNSRSKRTVAQGADQAADLPVAFASQAEPCAGRAQYGLMYRCGACGATHFGRSPVEVTTGKRIARCGRTVWLIVARTYRGPDEGAAA